MKNYLILVLVSLLLYSCRTQKLLLENASKNDLTTKLDTDHPGYIQNEGSKRSEDSLKLDWPPKGPKYINNSMGSELNNIFGSYTKFNSLSNNEDRDYIPKVIQNFVKKERLDLITERANISGRGVFFYIYNDIERKSSFNTINYDINTTRKLKLEYLDIDNFDIRADKDIDNFILTRTARGLIDTYIEGGIKPPYSSIELAAQKEKEQKSALVVLSGSFESPVLNNFTKNTEILLNLWEIYTNNPEIINNAYYLKSFNGVISKFIASKEDYNKLGGSGVLNYNGPLDSKIKAGITAETESSSLFSGTDWETIINVNNLKDNERENLFLPCPNPEQIKSHFENIREIPVGNEILVKDVNSEQQLEFFIPQVPFIYHQDGLWEIVDYSPEFFYTLPRLSVTKDVINGKEGIRFTFYVKPNTSIFGEETELDANKYVFFKIKSTKSIKVGSTVVELIATLDRDITLNKDPKISYPPQAGYEQFSSAGTFILGSDKNIKWTFKVKIASDKNNEILFQSGTIPSIRNTTATLASNGQTINLNHAIDIVGGTEKAYNITFSFLNKRFDFSKIDWNRNEIVNLSFDLVLPLKRGGETIRKINILLSYPIEMKQE